MDLLLLLLLFFSVCNDTVFFFLFFRHHLLSSSTFLSWKKGEEKKKHEEGEVTVNGKSCSQNEWFFPLKTCSSLLFSTWVRKKEEELMFTSWLILCLASLTSLQLVKKKRAKVNRDERENEALFKGESKGRKLMLNNKNKQTHYFSWNWLLVVLSLLLYLLLHPPPPSLLFFWSIFSSRFKERKSEQDRKEGEEATVGKPR